MVLKYACLNLPIDLDHIAKDLSSHQITWALHHNTAGFTGEWHIINLRQSSNLVGVEGDFQDFEDTKDMLLFPSIKKLIDIHFPNTVMAVRLMNLRAGAQIKKHRDHELNYENGEVRLHIPLQTHPSVIFHIDDETIHLPIGTCWYLNTNLPHAVQNPSNQDRIHLVIDSKVDPNIETLFNNATFTAYRKPEINRQQLQEMLYHLKQQNNPAAASLIKDIEKQLSE